MNVVEIVLDKSRRDRLGAKKTRRDRGPDQVSERLIDDLTMIEGSAGCRNDRPVAAPKNDE